MSEESTYFLVPSSFKRSNNNYKPCNNYNTIYNIVSM